MRATITTITVAGLLAASAGSAVARTDPPTGLNDAVLHAQAMRYQAEAAYYRSHKAGTAASASAPTHIVRVTRAPLADGGFDWADGGIGAGFAVALALSATGVAVVRRHSPLRTH